VGSFARNLRWWSQSRLASATAKLKLPPTDVTPSGPTNLEPALESIATQITSTNPTEVIVISDADTSIANPDRLAEVLTAKHARLHLLVTARGTGETVRAIAVKTGGQVLEQPDSKLWAGSSRQLARTGSAQPINRSDVTANYIRDLGLSNKNINLWNRTWLKTDATLLASARVGEAAIPMAAWWRVGAGQVIAVAFSPTAEEIETFTRRIQQQPRDPRFTLTVNSGPKFTVTLHAVDGQNYLNGLDVELTLGNQFPATMPQTAPGRYEISLGASRQPTFGSIRVGETIVERFAVAGRYPPEFDQTGNDREAMRRLAGLTGGAVIEPDSRGPIEFVRPRRLFNLTGILAGLGAFAIASGLLVWRNRRFVTQASHPFWGF
jgi:hypothetical protein